MTKKLLYKVLIVGAGKIGAFFDSPKHSHILTHAHAFTANKNFSLVGFVDSDLKKASQAAKIWGGQAFGSISEAVKKTEHIDVAVVATPDGTHAKVFKELAQYSLPLVFMEKPLANTLEEARDIVNFSAQQKSAVMINYSRRFVKEFQLLRDRIKQGTYGAYVTGTGYYGKGVLHNGSHLIDLARFLVGQVKDAVALGGPVDFYDRDPSVSAQLIFDTGKNFFLHAVDARVATIFEADLFFEKARVRILNSGFNIEESKVKESPVFPGYKIFSPARSVPTSLGRALAQAVKNIEGHLLRGEALLCDVHEAYRTIEISLKLARQGAR